MNCTSMQHGQDQALMNSEMKDVIQEIPGNDRCMDCRKPFPTWASVTFGILICLDCAGQHRSLGVYHSFVKSIIMDDWSPMEYQMMVSGGNAKWEAICVATERSDMSIREKYTHHPISQSYRERLAQVKDRGVVESSFTVREFLAQHVVVRHRCVRCQAADTCVCYRDSIYQSTSSPRPSSTPVSLTRHFFPPEEEDLCVRCTLCHVLIPLSELDGHSQSCHESSVVPKTTKTDTETWTEYEATLGVDSTHVPLGLSFTKHTGSGLAQVSDIVPGGAAAKAKIVPGSIVLTLNRCRVDFDRMVRGFSGGSSSFERPLTFRFRYDDHDHDSSRIRIRIPNIQNPKIQLHVPEPRLVETQVSFEKHHFPLACAFQYPETSGRPTVTRVSGYVADQGVLVGSKVVAMNNRRNFSNQELRNAIDSLESIEESLSLTFQRVEGLMRGWS